MTGNGLILAYDPGHNTGVAAVHQDGRLEWQRVLGAEAAAALAPAGAGVVLVGSGTGHAALVLALEKQGIRPHLVDEYGTTLAARKLYWRDNPPAGLLRLVPVGLRPQPAGLDGYAAWAIALAWLERQKESGHPGVAA